MKVLFIARAYPPVIGGIEKQNYDLSSWLSRSCEVFLIANTRGKIMLPFFAPYAFLKSLFFLNKIDIIVLGDGVLTILGFFLKFFSRKPVVCVVHGLDITYRNWFYQTFWPGFFHRKMDHIIAVGRETINQGVKRGLPADKFSFIPNGVNVPDRLPLYTKHDLRKLIGQNIKGPVLLTVGRLVKRKGISWFIENVMPSLSPEILFIVAGNGPERDEIQLAIDNNNLADRVFCLGSVQEKEKEILYSTADIFIQPNIKVEGDMEGFGLVVLEAASYGLPVIASDLEGLRDAVQDGENGLLVPEKNGAAYREKIEYLLADKAAREKFGVKARRYVQDHFTWQAISSRYIEIFERLTD